MSNTENVHCRLCAELKPQNELANMQTDDETCQKVVNKLSRFNIVMNFQENILPKTVCSPCVKSLEKAFTFVTAVEHAQIILTEFNLIKTDTLKLNYCEDISFVSPAEIVKEIDVKVENSCDPIDVSDNKKNLGEDWDDENICNDDKNESSEMINIKKQVTSESCYIAVDENMNIEDESDNTDNDKENESLHFNNHDTNLKDKNLNINENEIFPASYDKGLETVHNCTEIPPSNNTVNQSLLISVQPALDSTVCSEENVNEQVNILCNVPMQYVKLNCAERPPPNNTGVNQSLLKSCPPILYSTVHSEENVIEQVNRLSNVPVQYLKVNCTEIPPSNNTVNQSLLISVQPALDSTVYSEENANEQVNILCNVPMQYVKLNCAERPPPNNTGVNQSLLKSCPPTLHAEENVIEQVNRLCNVPVQYLKVNHSAEIPPLNNTVNQSLLISVPPSLDSTVHSEENVIEQVNRLCNVPMQYLKVNCAEIPPSNNTVNQSLLISVPPSLDSAVYSEEKVNDQINRLCTVPVQYVKVTWMDYEWKCSYCGTLFSNIEELQTHSIMYHRVCNAYQCTDCKIKKQRLNAFIKHVRSHRKYLHYSCYKCFEIFPRIVETNDHTRKIHENSIYLCLGCNTPFSSDAELKEHMNKYYKILWKKKTVTPDNLNCNTCNRTFTHITALRNHLNTHKPKKKDHICDRCGKCFVSKPILQNHMVTHGESLYHCEICKTNFKTVYSLMSHASIHSGIKPFTCDVCRKSYRTKGQITNHLKCHSDNLPFPCMVCSKKFRTDTNLGNHMYQHTGAKPFTCDICPRDFANLANRNKHMRRRHGVEMAKKRQAIIK